MVVMTEAGKVLERGEHETKRRARRRKKAASPWTHRREEEVQAGDAGEVWLGLHEVCAGLDRPPARRPEINASAALSSPIPPLTT